MPKKNGRSSADIFMTVSGECCGDASAVLRAITCDREAASGFAGRSDGAAPACPTCACARSLRGSNHDGMAEAEAEQEARVANPVQSARLADEEDCARHETAGEDSHADPAARGDCNAKFSGWKARGMAAGIAGAAVRPVLRATEAALCGTLSATPS